MKKRIAIALEINTPYPQHQGIYAGIQAYAQSKADWRCVIDEHPGLDPRHRGERHLPYDGVIARASIATQERLTQQGVPLVNTNFQTARPGLAGVYHDAHQAGYLAAEHLIERGFRRLSFICDKKHKVAAQMYKGFKQCAAESEIPCTHQQYTAKPPLNPCNWLATEKNLLGWLESLTPPTGLFSEQTHIARMVVELARELGWHVPQELAILCRDNFRTIVDVPPQISSLNVDYEQAGYEAARLLDQMMSGQAVPDRPILVPTTHVIARESTDYYAVEDDLVGRALRYIEANLHHKLRVDDIAYELAVSTRSLQMRFDAAMGRGISEEMRRLRLEKAKRMLGQADRPIGAIADLVGFGGAHAMGKIFRRELGMTPSAYRKQVIGERAKR